MTKDTLRKAVEILKGKPEFQELVCQLNYIIDNPEGPQDSPDAVSLENRYSFWACCLWTEMDIEYALNDEGIEATPDNIQWIINEVQRGLEDSMCENGNEKLAYAASRLKRLLEERNEK